MASTTRPLRLLSRTCTPPSRRTLTTLTARSLRASTASRRAAPQSSLYQSHPFSTSITPRKGLQPDSPDPSAPNTEPQVSHSNTDPAPLSEEEYHEKADSYLERLVLALEEKAESSPDHEVEYESGTLQLSTPQGTYVINKQRPNKQIWLSSPVSGPKRFDFVGAGAGQHEKEETEGGLIKGEGDDGQGGRWVYLRDGSGLSDLVYREVGVKVGEKGS